MRKFSFASIAKLSKRSLQSRRSFVPLALKGAGLVCTFAVVGEPSLLSVSACDAAQVHAEPKEEILSIITNDNSEDANKAKEVIQLIRKMLVYLQRLFAYMVLGVPVVCVGSTAYALGGVAPMFEDAIWDYCMWSIQLLGPTFVKLAQWASTRPDLYPPALIQRLESLQDNVKVNYSMDTVERTLAGAFGPDWKDIIEVEGKPLGAGCVAQVFKGTLKESSAKESQKIAIKLIHPHVEKMIQTDMELLGIFANFIDRFPSLEILSLGDTCREYCKMMNAQLDLRLEAYNLTEFSSKFADEPWAAFPVPIQGLVTRNVLVETLMEGSSIANFMRMKADKTGEAIDEVTKLKLMISDKGCFSTIKTIFSENLMRGDMHAGNVLMHALFETLMEGSSIADFMRIQVGAIDEVTKLKLKLSDLGCYSVIKMIFFDNLVHGDMHPGNILVQFNSKGVPRLVFLDAGIVYSSKNEESHKILSDICFALMEKDGYTAGKLMISNQKRSSGEDAEAFCVGVQQIIDESEEHLYFEHIGEYVGRICNLARVHSVKLDPSYFQIAMALKVMEGVALSLNEDLELVSKCIPLIIEARLRKSIGLKGFPSPPEWTDSSFMAYLRSIESFYTLQYNIDRCGIDTASYT